jgi:ABC-type sugar transport system permease subunit
MEKQTLLTPFAWQALLPTRAKFKRALSALRSRWKLYATIYLLILPTVVGMALFSYYPKIAVVKYSMFRWDAGALEEFRGLKNFTDAFADPIFWQTFKVVGILLAANLVKMWPCIFAAIVLHRLRNERWKYIYRVLFVVPMVIPALVWLLIWKMFYDPNVGVLNVLLRSTGLMALLRRMDSWMPRVATALTPVRTAVVDVPFGSVWGLGVVGAIVLTMSYGTRAMRKAWVWWVILLLAALGVWSGQLWYLAWFIPAVLLGQYLFRRGFAGQSAIKWIGGACIGAAVLFLLTTMIWTEPTAAFELGTPAWLGNSKLIIPALIFWGFPWVGTIGVLIYLAGLSNISQDVYEAADIDGAGPIGKVFYVELPLILGQVRINLIFMTINTLLNYGFFLILLGPTGGPGNVGMVPGLYMYTEAFVESRYGYACALGMVMFVMILILTVIYQKYIRVEK